MVYLFSFISREAAGGLVYWGPFNELFFLASECCETFWKPIDGL
jgi:hypothetical protein